MKVKIAGECPLLHEERTVTVEYLLLPDGKYLKGLLDCDYASQNDCDIECPLYKKANTPK